MCKFPFSDKHHFVIGVDFGTLSVRAVIVDVCNGEIICYSESEYEHQIIQSTFPVEKLKLPSDWCLQNPNDYLFSFEHVVRSVVINSCIPKEKIIGISIDFTSCTLLPVDKEGIPLCNLDPYRNRPHAYAKLWKHHAAQPYADEINQKLTTFQNPVEKFYGNQISSELLLPKVLQILREDPELFNAADHICEAGDWICRILTGEIKKSISMAGYKAMYFNDLGFPKNDFFEHIDVNLSNILDTKLRGSICKISEQFGSLCVEWASRLGLCAGIPLGCPIIDSHAGVVGSGICKEGQMMIALGTSSVQACLSHEPCSSNGIVGTICDTVVPGYYLWESGLAAVGDAFSSFSNLCLGKNDLIKELTEEAEKLSVGESGLLSLDWWNGNKTPFINSNLTGVIIGLKLSTSRGEIFRSLVEATAFGTRRILEQFEENGSKINEVIACGGIAHKNSFVMQVYADVIGKEIKLVKNEQTMAIGAAIYATVAAGSRLGGYDSIQDAVRAMTHKGTIVYRPSPNARKTYDELYKLYNQLSSFFGKENFQFMNYLTTLKTKNECNMT